MLDYTIFFKKEFATSGVWSLGESWDVFLSAFNASERVRILYDQISSHQKYWIVHPEYGLAPSALPAEPKLTSSESNEGDFILHILDQLEKDSVDFSTASLCVDITGFLRPHLMFLVQALYRRGVKCFHVVYAEPTYYKSKAATKFSTGSITEVRQVAGYEGISNSSSSDDLLIIGMGFDSSLAKEVAEDKDKAAKIQLFGLPSLRADMYQQSVLRSREIADWIGDPTFSSTNRSTAPANDPFATATQLSRLIGEREVKHPATNIYLSPLGTKPQVLGFSLFYVGECIGKNRSIIFPFSTKYSPETTAGISRVWLYTIEFPLF